MSDEIGPITPGRLKPLSAKKTSWIAIQALNTCHRQSEYVTRRKPSFSSAIKKVTYIQISQKGEQVKRRNGKFWKIAL